MQKFQYRSARFAIDVPIQFIHQDGTTAGRCREISRDGIKVEICGSFAINSSGKVVLSFNEHALEVEVCIAYVKEGQCGMKFIYRSEAELNMVEDLMDLLARPPKRISPNVVR